MYRSPAVGHTGDLNWRLVHKALATQVLLQKFNPSVSNSCPFCMSIENLNHAFTECKRLSPLFLYLSRIFCKFEIVFFFSNPYLWARFQHWKQICGFAFEFFLGIAGLAICKTRKARLVNKKNENAFFLSKAWCLLV